MTENFYTLITDIGIAKIANANVLGTKVNFTTLVIGDGNGNYYNPTASQTTLVSEVWRGNINNVYTDEVNTSWIVIETVLPANIGGFTVREVGILDDVGDMIAVAKYPATVKPVLSQGSSKDLMIKTILEVANTASITLKIDPTVTLATKKDINVLSNKIDNLAGTGRTTETVKKNADDIKGIKEGTLSFTNLETVDKTLTGAINELKAKDDSLSTQMADMATNIGNMNTNIETLEKQQSNYNVYSSNKDINGIYTVVEYKRSDGTLYMKSTLSGGTSPNYTTNTWQLYDLDGITLLRTLTWTITYDADGQVISKVVA